MTTPVPEGSGWFGYSSLIESVLRHNVSWAKYNRMLSEQGGFCPICDRHETSVGPLVIEHDHHSNTVRGLTCQRCNLVLGHAKDDPFTLIAAAKYLLERGCEATAPPEPETVEALERMRRQGIISDPLYPEERALRERDAVRKGLRAPQPVSWD